jgi:shikimate kinase
MMTKPYIIYIIGFMGSGKTTAGKKLASLLGWSFIDLDKRIEEYAGKTIPEIF